MKKLTHVILLSGLLICAAAQATPLSAYSQKLASASDSGVELNTIVTGDQATSGAAIDSTQLKIAGAEGNLIYEGALVGNLEIDFADSGNLAFVTPQAPRANTVLITQAMTPPTMPSAQPDSPTVLVSEPGTLLLLMLGIVALALRRKS